MFYNVISFKNGKTLPFQTKLPFSVDKVIDGWNVVVDDVNNQILSFRGSEIVTIASMDSKDIESKPKKKPKIKTKITTEN